MLLFKLDRTFMVAGGGLILTPGLGDKSQFVKKGSQIRLVRPDKSEIVAEVKGITMEGNQNIIIGVEFSNQDLPEGTEVWLKE